MNGLPTRGMGKGAGSLACSGFTRGVFGVIAAGVGVFLRLCYQGAVRLRLER